MNRAESKGTFMERRCHGRSFLFGSLSLLKRTLTINRIIYQIFDPQELSVRRQHQVLAAGTAQTGTQAMEDAVNIFATVEDLAAIEDALLPAPALSMSAKGVQRVTSGMVCFSTLVNYVRLKRVDR